MAVTEATPGVPLGECVAVVTHHSGFSQATFGAVPEKEAVPSAPVIDSVTAPTESSGVLVLHITLPTTDTDGEDLAQLEIVKIRMHHSTSSGVDANDSYVDFPKGATLTWAPGDVVAHYVAIRVQDSHDNWSALSNEESGTANSGATHPENDGLWAHRLGTDAIWTEDSPDTNSIAWADVILYWKDSAYPITDGNTDKAYIWWDYSLSTTTFQTSDTAPTLSFEDVVVAYNDNGKIYLTMYSPMVIADFLRAGVIQSANYAAAVGSLINLNLGRIVLGGSDENGTVLEADGSVQHGSDFVWDTTELVMLGTYKTANAGERIALYGASAGADAHYLVAYDAVGKRIALNEAELRIYESDTVTTLTVFPSTPATTAFIGNDALIVNNTLIVGRDTDPTTADILHVTGDALFTGEVVVGDHNEGDTPSVVNVIFYTAGNIPDADTVPRGTLAFQVPA